MRRRDLSVYSPEARTKSSQSSELQGTNEMLSDARAKLEPYLKERAVDLKGQNLSNIDVWALANLLGEKKYAHISEVNLAGNDFTDAGVVKLMAAVEKNENLHTLRLDENALNSGALYSLSLAIPNSSVLSLSLAECFEEEEKNSDSVTFLSEIIEQSQLVDLNLASFKLKGDLKPFANALQSNSSLKRLNLENTFVGDGLKTFVDALCEPNCGVRLEELKLDYCHVENPVVLGPIFSHGNFKNLMKLSLVFLVRPSGSGETEARTRNSMLQVISEHMKANKSIRELNLRMNQIKCLDCTKLCQILTNPSALEVVDISDNNIGAIGFKNVLVGVKRNTKLRNVIVENNPFLESDKATELKAQLEEFLIRNKREQSKVSQNTQGTHQHIRGTEIVSSKLKRGSGGKSMDQILESEVPTEKKAAPRKRGKRNFAKKLDEGRILAQQTPNIRRVPSPSSANDNLDNDDSTFVLIETESDKKTPPPAEKKTGGRKRNFAKKLNKVSKKKSEVKEEIQCGSHNDNLNEEYSSVVFNAEPAAPKQRKFAAKKNLLKIRATPKREIKDSGSHNNNLDGEDDTCIFNSSADAHDEEDSVVFQNETEQDDDSVVYDDEEQIEEVRAGRDPKKVFEQTSGFNNDSFLREAENDDDLDETDTLDGAITEPDKGTWALSKISKSELGFIKHMQELMAQSEDDREVSGILNLQKKNLEQLSQMLGEWENLLDRDEHMARGKGKMIRIGSSSGKRAFAGKLGVIGKLHGQESGDVVNYTLAKSAIGQTLISRALVRNIYLLSLFDKLQREIGSGVPTKVGGMLPSILLDGLVDKHNPLMPTVERLESFASSFLLIKVVVWSVLKALCISNPEVDPNGRHLLEEFGKAMFDKNENKIGQKTSETFESESEEEINRKSKEMGKTILSGAAYELIDALILLKPMLAVADAIFGAGVNMNNMIKLEVYERLQQRKEKIAMKKITARMKKINKQKKYDKLKQILKGRNDVIENQQPGDRTSVRTKLTTSTGKPNGIEKILRGVEKLVLKKESEATNKPDEKDATKKKRRSQKITITPEVQLYRHNCKERLRTILQDIKGEAKSLDIILGVQGFLPMVFAFVDMNDVQKHYERRTAELQEKIPGWFTTLGEEFQSEFINTVKEPVADAVSKFIRADHIYDPSKPEEEEKSELQKRFAKMKVGNKASPRTAMNVDKSTKSSVEGQSFFEPMLNQIFSPMAMSPGSTVEVRKVIEAKLRDSSSSERKMIVKKVQNLCKFGGEDTDFMILARIQEQVRESGLDL